MYRQIKWASLLSLIFMMGLLGFILGILINIRCIFGHSANGCAGGGVYEAFVFRHVFLVFPNGGCTSQCIVKSKLYEQYVFFQSVLDRQG